MSPLIEFARRHLIADAAPLSPAERRRSALAGLAGVLLAGAILAVLPVPAPLKQMLPPMGASAVILFTLPHSPLAQPWSLVGGLSVSALIGLLCGHLIPLPMVAAALAVALAIFAMAALRCLHPPGGALALLTALAAGQSDPATVLAGVACNVVAMLAAVMAINNIVPGRRYPQCTSLPVLAKDAPPRLNIAHEDLQHALHEIDAYLDISEEDLVDVYNRATEHAFRRHARLRCRDVMTPSPVTVDFATDLNEAWALLRRHNIQSLPVIDRSRHVLGLLSLEDFLAHVPPDPGQRIGDNLRTLLRPTVTVTSDKPEVAGQIMRDARDDIIVAEADDDLAATAASLGRRHQHAVPVVDENHRLIGILTQGDVIAGLFGQLALADARKQAA
jgi:CBS domain-containing membrane protein